MTDSNPIAPHPRAENVVPEKHWIVYLLVLLIAGAIYLGGVVSPRR